jgi:hypothetical protein
VRPLRGRITARTVDDNPYLEVFDRAGDPEDDESLRPHRNPGAVGLHGWGPVACGQRGWESRIHRESALQHEAERRVARRA